MKVLIHFDRTSTSAYGLWWEADGQPQCLYRVPDGPWEARGRMIVFNISDDEISWGERFDQLTTRAPYSENWAVYDSMGLTPQQMLDALTPSEPLVS